MPRRVVPISLLPEPVFARAIQIAVVRHDEMGIGGDEELVRRQAIRLEHVHLVEHDFGIDDDPVADDGRDVRIHDPRRNQVQLESTPAVDDGVPCVVTTLEANDVVHVVGEQVGDLPLAFVAPLGADQHDTGHMRLLP